LGVSRANNYLSKNERVQGGALILQDISIERFIPDEAVAAQGLKLIDNFHHWLIVFRFGTLGDNSSKTGNAVYTLLDGTILQE